jgi:hypothetical protein
MKGSQKYTNKKRSDTMRNIRYLGLLCLGCLIIGAAAAFSPCDGSLSPAFCNKIETGNSMVLSTGSLSSSVGDRFITASAGSAVELFNNIDVSSYSSDLPSKGFVSSYLKGMVMEAGQDTAKTAAQIAAQIPAQSTLKPYESTGGLTEFVSFIDSTSVSGDIFSFSKHMSYSSIWA